MIRCRRADSSPASRALRMAVPRPPCPSFGVTEPIPLDPSAGVRPHSQFAFRGCTCRYGCDPLLAEGSYTPCLQGSVWFVSAPSRCSSPSLGHHRPMVHQIMTHLWRIDGVEMLSSRHVTMRTHCECETAPEVVVTSRTEPEVSAVECLCRRTGTGSSWSRSRSTSRPDRREGASDGEVLPRPNSRGGGANAGRGGVTVDRRLEPVDPRQQLLEAHPDQVGGVGIVEIGSPARYAAAGDDLTRNADHHRTWRHGADHHGVGADAGVVPDLDRPEDFSARTHRDPVSEAGVPLSRHETRSTQGDALVQGDVLADLGGLADHHAQGVVDEQPWAEDGTGMDIDSGEHPRDRRDEPPEQQVVTAPEPVGQPVRPNGVQTRVAQHDLGGTARRGVAVTDRPYVTAHGGEHDVSRPARRTGACSGSAHRSPGPSPPPAFPRALADAPLPQPPILQHLTRCRPTCLLYTSDAAD